MARSNTASLAAIARRVAERREWVRALLVKHPTLTTDEIAIKIGPAWSTNGQICIRQSDPLPLTVLSISAETVIAG